MAHGSNGESSQRRKALACLGAGLVLLAASLSSPAWAADAAGTVLPVGASEFPPFEYKDADGKVVGADTEIVEAVLRRAGYVPDIKMQPWARVQQSAERGAFAVVYSMTKTPEREGHYLFSDPINMVRDVFFKRKTNALHWKAFEDLKGMRMASSGGYGYDASFKQAIADKRFASTTEVWDGAPELSGLRLLTLGTADIFVCEISVCQYLIKSNAPKFDGLDFSPTPIGPVRPYYAAFPKSWPQAEKLQREFNAGLARLVQEGERRKILLKYRMDPNLP